MKRSKGNKLVTMSSFKTLEKKCELMQQQLQRIEMIVSSGGTSMNTPNKSGTDVEMIEVMEANANKVNNNGSKQLWKDALLQGPAFEIP